MKQLLEKIGNFFTGLFNAAKRTYNRASGELQAAIKFGSGFVNVINQNLQNPDLKSAVLKAFPSVNIDELTSKLTLIAQKMKLIEQDSEMSFDEILAVIQKYLASLDGTFWAGASRYIASIVAIVDAPAGTKIEAVASLIGYVYHDLIKKH